MLCPLWDVLCDCRCTVRL